MAAKIRLTEAEAEQKADRLVQQRLSASKAYNNAEDAEEQQKAEDEISEAVWREIEDKYRIA